MRYFHNFFGQFQINQKWGIITGFDIGAQQTDKGSSDLNIWYSPVIIARYAPIEKISLAARAEFFSDKNQVIISTATANGFQTFGYSLNLDYNISSNMLWRIEGRAFSSKDDIFTSNQKPSSQNYFATTSLAISF